MDSSHSSNVSSQHYAALLQTVSEMRIDLEKTTMKIKSLENQNEQLQNNYSAAKDELVDMKKKFHEARESYLSAVQDKFDAEQHHETIIERLKSQLQDKTKEFEKIRDELVPHDIDQLRIKVQEELEIRHKQELKSLENECELQREKNFSTRRELEKLRTEYTSLLQNQQNEINSLRLEKEQLLEAARLESLKHRQVESFDGKDEKIRSHTGKIAELSHLVELLRDEVKTVRQERDELSSLYDQTRVKLEHIQVNMKAKIAGVENEKHSLEQRMHTLENDLDKKEALIRSLKLSNEDLSNRLDDSSKEHESAQRTWNVAKTDLLRQIDFHKDIHEKEVVELTEQIESLRGVVNDREDMLRRIQREASEIEQRAEGMERELRRSHLIQLQDVRKRLINSEMELADATQQMRTLQDQALATQEQLTFEKDSLLSELNRLKREKDILYSKLRDMENGNETQRKKMMNESQELTTKLSAAEKKVRDVNTQQSQLEGKITTLNSKILDLESDRQRERNHYDQLEQRYSQLLLQVDAMKSDFHSQLQSVAPSVKERMENLQKQMNSALAKERKRAEGYKTKALEAHYKIKALGENQY